MGRDLVGTKLASYGAGVEAIDARTFEIRLAKPFPAMLFALGSGVALIPVIMRARDVEADPTKPVTTAIGSGPFRFNHAARVSGALTVFDRNTDYVPRKETPDGLTGARLAKVDRVEWKVIPDASTAAAALQAGEVDMWEFICLESEGSPIRFRNIRLQKLPDGAPLPPEQRCLPDEGFRSIFDGSLRGWRESDAAIGHWTPQDWRLDYDGHGDDLWTEASYGDFELVCDWRWVGKPTKAKVPEVRPDGSQPLGADGKPALVQIDDYGDSGILLRGNDKSQVNIWCWPVGSGEVYGYRNDIAQPAAVRRAVTPSQKADAPPGQWNRFRIRMVEDRLTVNLNGRTVIEDAQLPGVPRRGPIGLQHHGAPIEFANIFVRELKPDAK